MVYEDQHVVELVELRVKVDDLPPDALQIELGKDLEPYYTFKYNIEVTYLSGSAKYALVYNGQYRIPSIERWK
jgi:hypothetical protein